MARYNIALATLLASKAYASEVSIDPNGAIDRSLFSKIPSLVDVATKRFLEVLGVEPSGHPVCVDPGFNMTMDDNTLKILSTMAGYEAVISGLQQYKAEGITVGSTTQLACEASDAAVSGAPIEDGLSGDVDFPHGNIKAVATGGERSVCDDTYGLKITGTPDGIGAYLVDDKTVRVVVQSEGYGPLRIESYNWPVNDGAASFGGSHVQYVDYDRSLFAKYMSTEMPASDMVVGMGEMIQRVVNLKGEPVGKRNGESETAVGAHYGNTDASGKYTMWKMPNGYDWFLQSLCSAHLEQKHQWGEGIGLEDNMFITNEEWANFQLDQEFVGQSAHALDLDTKTLYAVGGFTNGGFEKNVEINIAISGYNGAFDNGDVIPGETIYPDHITELRNELYGPRTDGKNYTWTMNIVPYRIYVGIKGKLEDGSDAPADDFLARNGLKYGQIYGFAVDMNDNTTAPYDLWRDAYHKTAVNGDKVEGKWIPQAWRWDGEVKNFQHDGAWDYQNKPPNTGDGSGLEGYEWWTSKGPDAAGCKTEHNSPDPREGQTAFIQASTCGYFGHLYVKNVPETFAAANGDFPAMFDGDYFVYQGETDITQQVMLGGKGQHTEGRNATMNWDKDGIKNGGKATFEDIDGFEIMEDNGKLYAIIQEDSGSKLGERAMITSALEHEADGEDLTYYFIAMSGGEDNSRMVAGVGIPKGVACHDGESYVSGAHEFSGVFDTSGLTRKDELGNFVMKASDTGLVKRQQDRLVSINDKNILMTLQTGLYSCGVIGAFQSDRGGQWLLYKPDIPV
eukprot:scaffold790_cov149-Skeletonema_menzelii.AAC.23